MLYNIYTDGSTIGNGKEYSFGGWSFVCVETGVKKSDYDDSGNTTNNREELKGILEAIKYSIELKKNDKEASIIIHSDSQYSINAVTKWIYQWKKNSWKRAEGADVKNRELIENIYNLIKFPSVPITFVKVRGHSGNEYNEIADNLATEMSAIAKEQFSKRRSVENGRKEEK